MKNTPSNVDFSVSVYNQYKCEVVVIDLNEFEWPFCFGIYSYSAYEHTCIVDNNIHVHVFLANIVYSHFQCSPCLWTFLWPVDAPSRYLNLLQLWLFYMIDFAILSLLLVHVDYLGILVFFPPHIYSTCMFRTDLILWCLHSLSYSVLMPVVHGCATGYCIRFISLVIQLVMILVHSECSCVQ